MGNKGSTGLGSLLMVFAVLLFVTILSTSGNIRSIANSFERIAAAAETIANQSGR